ncbi:MAG: Histidine triad (HIT) protein [Candidatus Kuenenbacteria bacterium GW2011_GWA2_42_15]|uniref:Histidine triad (HIT) protein n=2 Tax=Candidatus Kueneniibacteriota TaxID=1752740 RepID=A0A0G0YVF6_9BACT|nr:MAG: Histidine triad (HIT) protein [Candidatus Kuenenbacteria bacterium GW2011_GWA2_42_15]
MECVFCKIIKGEIPAAKIYEDEKIFAFLDINPVNAGHTLVVPKEHYQWLDDTPDELLVEVVLTAKRLLTAIRAAIAADYVAVNVIGVDVPHFHVHLIPRYFSDNFVNWPARKYREKEMEETAEKIQLYIK